MAINQGKTCTKLQIENNSETWGKLSFLIENYAGWAIAKAKRHYYGPFSFSSTLRV